MDYEKYEKVREEFLTKGNPATFQKALDEFEAELKSHPKDKWAWHGKGFALKALGRHKDAIETYEEVVKEYPELPYAWTNLGISYYKLGRGKEALLAYEKAIKIDPKKAFPWHNKGACLYILGKNEDAISAFEKAIEIDQKYATPWNGLGYVHAELGQHEKAVDSYKMFLSLKKGEDYWTGRAREEISDLEFRIGNELINLINEAIEAIKGILLYKEKTLTHYTSLTVGKFLIVPNETGDTSGLRASEATFTNDPSEGKALFEYLENGIELDFKLGTNGETYTEKPFLACFVPQDQNDDLTMWRFYGKEGQEDACGCSITLDKKRFSNQLFDFLNEKIEATTSNDDQNSSKLNPDDLFQFYQVAYYDEKNKRFHLPQGAQTSDDAKAKDIKLNRYLKELKEALEAFNKGTHNDENVQYLRKQLAEIVYLFKNAHYKHEREVRMLLDNVALNSLGIQKIDTKMTPPRVYLELCRLIDSIENVIIGPKTAQGQQWVGILHYSLKDLGRDDIKVKVSSLPYQ